MAAVILVLFYAVMLLGIRHESATFDEPGHVTAGYSYWKYNDYRLDPENGNLTQRWMALPLLFTGAKFPEVPSQAWSDSDVGILSDEWLHRIGNDGPAMMAYARAMAGLFAVGAGLLVWLWSRHLFGPIGAMISLLMYVLCPTVLGHGALTTSDMAVTFFLLLALYAATRVLEKLTPTRILVSAFLFAALFAAKMSAVLIIPIVLVMVVIRVLNERPLPIGFGRIAATRGQRSVAILAATLVHGLVFFGFIWAIYGFRYSAFRAQDTNAHYYRSWQCTLNYPKPRLLMAQLGLNAQQQEQVTGVFSNPMTSGEEWSAEMIAAVDQLKATVLTRQQREVLDRLMTIPPAGLVPRFVAFAREHHLLPEPFLYGYAGVWKVSIGGVNAFFRGEIYAKGSRWFFPFTFTTKTPVSVFLLAGLAVSAAYCHRRDVRVPVSLSAPMVFRTLPLWLLFATFWVAALLSHINIGHRHLLPVYPPLFVLCGAIGWWFESRELGCNSRTIERMRLAVFTLLAALFIEVALRFPNYIAYFNGIVRPSEAYRYVVDSSVDWGQDLPALKKYIDARPEERSYLAYFGTASPMRWGIEAQQIFGFRFVDRSDRPSLLIASGVEADFKNERLQALLKAQPHMDNTMIFSAIAEGQPCVILLKRPSDFRLRGGAYYISASLFYPLHLMSAIGYWDEAHELKYWQVRSVIDPLTSDDPKIRSEQFPRYTIAEWANYFNEYEAFRFGRLTAYLRRQKQPDHNINGSMLVFHLTDAEVRAALDGPAPVEMR